MTSPSVHPEFDATDQENGEVGWWERFAECSAEAASGNLRLEHLDLLLAKETEFRQKIAWKGLKHLGSGQEPVRKKSQLASILDLDKDFVSDLDKGLEQAIERYEEAARTGSDSGPYIVIEYVPFFAFEEWYKKAESVWRIAFQYTDAAGGAVLLYGDPSHLHEYISSWFGHVLSDAISLLTHRPSREVFRMMGASGLALANGFHKEPDFTFQPKPCNLASPPIIGEVAYANESLTALKAELVMETLPGYARIAYGVKVWKKRGDEKVALRFLERTSEEFTKDIDFSPEFCTARNDPRFVVTLPLRILFQGGRTDEYLLSAVVTFDLYELQQEVMELLHNNTVNYVWRKKSPPLLTHGATIKKKKRANRLVSLLKSMVKKKHGD